MNKIFGFISIFLLSFTVYAKSTTQTIGDILSVAIPMGAYSNAYFLNDKDGEVEFAKSYLSAVGVAWVMKNSIQEKRPDSDERDSFPSGHSVSAFSGASFIHKRYGLKYAIIPYIAAIYTGYSRVHSHRHYRKDVYTGALLGIISSLYFVTEYDNCKVQLASKNGKYEMQFLYKF